MEPLEKVEVQSYTFVQDHNHIDTIKRQIAEDFQSVLAPQNESHYHMLKVSGALLVAGATNLQKDLINKIPHN